MKVIVKKFMDVRVEEPRLSAPSYQRLAPESELEVDGTLYKGDAIEGNDNWYKDGADNYYWSGGVEKAVQATDSQRKSVTDGDISHFNSIAQFPPQLIDWNSRIAKLPQSIKDNLGNGIKVAVLDTGIEKKHLDIYGNVVDSVDFTNANVHDLDIQGHGTEMASIIAANPFFADKGIRGVAPEAKIYSAKVMYDENDPQDFLNVGNALDYAYNNSVDIINLSIGRQSQVQAVADKIAQSANAILFASTKEFDPGLSPAQLIDLFPGNCPEVIPVSALKKDYILQYWNQLPSPLIIMPLIDAWCCSIEYRKFYYPDSGSSISTAFISGITALLLANKPSTSRNRQNILAELKNYASTVEEAFINTGSEIHFIIKD